MVSFLSPSTLEWALLLLALVVAAALRMTALEQLPPGLYRDEAFNGLDALKVLKGQHALYFPANNGREPLYIYLTAAAVALFGQTTFAVRFGAVMAGTAATAAVYLLGRSWFGARVGLLAAWIWAITLWPLHLSRIGLRVILMVPLLAMTFWLATTAYRLRKTWLWVAAGFLYGLAYYTYLAVRFTPVLLLLVGFYLLFTGRARRLWPGALWFLGGLLVALVPLLLLFWQQPDLLFGRVGQVSVFHPDVHHGDPWGALGSNILAAGGMFLWRGDTILRHNPAGRPVFDLFMAIPFLWGVVWCLRRWRAPAAAITLLWTAVMLGPTILAEDAPHFLRAAGVLPVVVFFPAIGLAAIASWRVLPRSAGPLLAAVLLGGSLLLTVANYTTYARDPEVAFRFESAAAELAGELNAEADGTAIFLDERLWSSWPSISFLVTERGRVTRYLSPDALPAQLALPAALYAWPYEPLAFVPQVLPETGTVSVTEGALARGDLEELAYPLYVRYGVSERPIADEPALVEFGDQWQLLRGTSEQLDERRVAVDIYWQVGAPVEKDAVVFVHVAGPDGLVGQHDGPPGAGRWPAAWWRPGLVIHDRLVVSLSEPYDPDRHEIRVGLYDPLTGDRLPVTPDVRRAGLVDFWVLQEE